MSTTYFSARGYAHLYRSILRFARLEPPEAQDLIYHLNTANIDTIRYANPSRPVHEMSEAAFFRFLNNVYERPYRTEVQLYKAMEALSNSIRWYAITDEQRNALLRLNSIMETIAWRFHKTFGMHIDDARSVYAQCSYHLVPNTNEPSVCLRGMRLFQAS